MAVKLYGIHNCDRCRAARRWLEAEGVTFTFHDLRKQGLSKERLHKWLQQRPITDLVNRRSSTWRALSDADKAAVSKQVTGLPMICQQPTLLKRPLLEVGTRLLNGFSENDYRHLLQQETAP